jgi:DNA mismatch repair ATPase MutS
MIKKNIHEEYLDYHDKFEKKYGKGISIVLMQVGSFHEAYSTQNRGPDLYKLSDILNIVCTKKDKSIDIISEQNPFMMGFPSIALQKFLKILIDNKYIVIIIDQTTLPPNPTREITGIYSDATFLEGNSIDCKHLMMLYIEINPCINNQKIDKSKSNISIGMVTIEISTGYINYYETHGSGILSENEALEECQRYYHYFRPSELVFYLIDNSYKDKDKDKDSEETQKYIKNLNKSIHNKIDIIPNQILFTYNKINSAFTKISYQNNIFKKIYPFCSNMMSPIETLGLEKSSYASLSITLIFDWIHQHNANLLKEIQKPVYFDNHKYMILGNNAQYQLNIVDYYNYENNNSKFNSIKYQSLNDVVNNCITNMGKRKLKMRLIAPYTDRNIIQNYYDLTEKILNLDTIYEQIRNQLKEICDIERILRKITIKFIQPYELYQLYYSLISIIDLIQLLLSTSFKDDLLLMFNKKNINIFNECVNYINKLWNIEKLKKNNLLEIKENLYNDGIYNNIDNIVLKINNGIGFMEKLAKKLEYFIEIKNDNTKKNITKIAVNKINNDDDDDDNNNKLITIKHNDRDGYYLITTKSRGNKLKEEIKKLKKIQIDDKTEILITDLIFKDLNNTTKITYYGLEKYSDEVETLYESLNSLMKEYFCKDVKIWSDKYSVMLSELIKFIIEIDIITNNAFTSKKFHYTKPIIKFTPDNNVYSVNNELTNIIEKKIESEKELELERELERELEKEFVVYSSFVHAKELRHPIIEQIIDHEYVPHDVKLDNKDKGNMIYGTNSCGKCFSKDTLIMMFTFGGGNKTYKKAINIQEGDLLMGDDSTPRTVIGVTSGEGDMYEIIPKHHYHNNNNFIVNGHHILCLKSSNYKSITKDNNRNRYKASWFENGFLKNKLFSLNKYQNAKEEAEKFIKELIIPDNIIEISVNDYLNKNKFWKKNHFLYKVGIEFPEKKVNIEPYLIGYYLCTEQSEHNKYILDDYKYNSKKNRFNLLAGIIDSCGVNSDQNIDIYLKNSCSSINDELRKDIIFLTKSLGFISIYTKIDKNKNYYKIHISGTFELFKELSLYLKYFKINLNIKYINHSLISFNIIKKGIDKYYGFETDNNKRFLLDSFIVTHNSSLMKAVGLNIIMAQCGLYVPAANFEYNIFTSIYTRISGNDNLFKGQSSFIVEMNELRSILKRCNSTSLVIGDEICRGTEHLSGTAIVGSTIIRLIQNNAKFLFATHLHDLPNLTQIKKLNNIQFYHLSVESKGDELIFNRKLVKGTGEQVYGITIAKYILDDTEFIKTAIELKNDLLDKKNINYKLVNDKKSLYNNDLFIDKCTICNSENNLETHHIVFQKYYKKTPFGEINNKKFHVVKNHKANLIVLCQQCHDNLHNGELEINSLVQTTNGIEIK